MGLLDGLMGNASEVDASKAQADFAPILTPKSGSKSVPAHP